jgi:antitoxin (DNA-binding transcriptional repressor) of toxin-antitoxin stability system
VFSEKVERSGEKVVIKRHGRAVAEIHPISHISRLKVDATLKKVKIMGDLTSPSLEEWELV